MEQIEERKPDTKLEQILNKYNRLPKDEKIEVLEEALLKMKQNNLRTVDKCKALAMGYAYNKETDNWNKV